MSMCNFFRIARNALVIVIVAFLPNSLYISWEHWSGRHSPYLKKTGVVDTFRLAIT